MPSRFADLVTSCLGSVQRITDVGDHEDSLLSYEDIGHHAYGKFSMAIVQANQLLEDQGQVESGPFGTFIGIYDGHNGPDVSKFISRNLFRHISRFASEKGGMSVEVLQMAFNATEEGFEALVVEAWPTAPQIATVGSCCLVGVINDGTVYIANAGDSRAVLGSIFRATGAITPVQLTTEHNAGIEAVRQELRALHPDDSHIVMQKRGVWRVKGVIQGIARRLIRVALEEAAKKREMRYSDLKKIERGIRRHFHDDITVIVVFLDHELMGHGSRNGAGALVRVDRHSNVQGSSTHRVFRSF